jgi:hypothetical protein
MHSLRIFMALFNGFVKHKFNNNKEQFCAHKGWWCGLILATKKASSTIRVGVQASEQRSFWMCDYMGKNS